MNIRVIFAIVGVVVALVSGALLGLGHTSVPVQICLALGFATAFIAVGCEHFFRESPMLSSYRSRKASIVVGCVFITVGVGLLALVTSNLMLGRTTQMDPSIKKRNEQLHGGSGPFLVCVRTSLAPGSAKPDGWVSTCPKCGTSVHIPERDMVPWRNTGAGVVCVDCSGGKPGQILETF